MRFEMRKGQGLGKISPMPKEIEEVRKTARASGEDPDVAEMAFRERLSKASARLRSN